MALVEEFVRNSATQFDPEVVEAVVACVERGELQLFARTDATPLGGRRLDRHRDDVAPVSVVPRPLAFPPLELSTEVECRTMG